MPINHADGTTLGAIVVCPVVAGIAAGKVSHSVWLATLFIILGIVPALALAKTVHTIAYLILSAGIKARSAWISWPLFAAYMIVPSVVTAAGFAVVWFSTIWLLTHIG